MTRNPNVHGCGQIEKQRQQAYLPGREEHRLLELGVESRDEDGRERAIEKRIALEVLVQQPLQSPWLILRPRLERRPEQASPVCT
jgi:hypothetical protein